SSDVCSSDLIKVPVYVLIHSFSYAQSLDGNKRVKQVQNLNEQIDKVEGVIYVSKTSKYKGNELGIHSHENEVVIHNAIKRYNSINTQKEKKDKIIFIGSFIPEKGIPVLVQALKKGDSIIEYVQWVGAGEMEGFIKKEFAHTNIEFSILNNLKHQKAMEFLSKSKVLVVPSKSESFGLVYVEALSLGIPVIGYNETLNEFKYILREKSQSN